MAFIIGPPFEIVDGIGGLRQRFGRIREVLFYLGPRAGQERVGLIRLCRHGADAADDGNSLLDRIAVDIEN